MLDKVDVCVVGAGIGGLSVALALQQAGFKVVVVERDASMVDRKQGYGLTLTNSLTGPLAKMGLLDQCIERNCPSHCHFVFDPQGEVQGYFGRALKDITCDQKPLYQQADHGGNRGNLRIPRQELRQMMISRLLPGTIRWGLKLESYEESDSCVDVLLHPQNSDSDLGSAIPLRASVLIGGDGLWSKVRRLYDPQASLIFLGISVIIGISSISDPLLTDMGYYVMDGTQRLFTMPFLPCAETGDTAQQPQLPLIMWQLSFSGLTEDEALQLKQAPLDDILANALQRTESWFPAVRALISATIKQEVWATPLYDRDAMDVSALHEPGRPTRSKGRVTVVGDACHPMSMFKGQGANQALEDAPHLATMLLKALQRDQAKAERRIKRRRTAEATEAESLSLCAASWVRDEDGCILTTLPLRSLSAALRQFEREMVARTSKKVLASRQAAHLLHSPAVFADLPTVSKPAETLVEREDGVWKIAGVAMQDYVRFTQFLRERGVNAQACASGLETQLVEAYRAFAVRGDGAEVGKF